MSNISVGYVNGSISVKRREQLKQGQLDRLLSARDEQEALRALSEFGWVSGDVSGVDYEKVTAAHMREACQFVRQNSPLPEATDCFLLHYDIDNLKLLLKARLMGATPRQLSDCGTLPLEMLQHAVNEGNYRDLPETLTEALDALEKRQALTDDGMDIDVTLDAAMYRMIFAKLEKVRSAAIREYFTCKVDLTNALSLLRFEAMGKDFTDYEQVYLPQGRVSLALLKDAFSAPEQLHRLYARYGRDITESIESAQASGGLAALEKVVDDYLLSLFRPYKFHSESLEAVIGYLLERQREVAAVRLVMAAKANDFAPEAVGERLRELHG